ncbi:hypothetical protein Tco_0018988 [Tanacetum coccineum]
MSSATSAVTYTSVYTNSEPGRAFWGADDEEVSEGGIPRVIILGYDGLPMQPVAPTLSPVYHTRPRGSTNTVSSSTRMSVSLCSYRHMILTTCQSLYTLSIYHWRMTMSFQLRSSHYLLLIHLCLSQPVVTESDPEEDPEEYENDKTEDGPVDYPMDGEDDRDDDDGDSSRDNADGEDEDDEEREEEHLAPGRLCIVVHVDEACFPLRGTKAVITHHHFTDITIGLDYRPAFDFHIPSPEAEALIDAITAALPSPPLPPLLPSLYIPPPVDCRDDIPESEQPPRKRLYLSTLGSRYEVRESSTARPTRDRGIDYGFFSTVDAEERRQGTRDVGYNIRDTWVDPTGTVPEIAPMTVGEVNTRVTELAELHEHDTYDLYALLDDAQDIWMVEEEAYASREAWAYSIGLSQATHQELQTHRDHVYAHETHLQAHQTQLQLQGTLIQTQHQVHETRFQMKDAELAALRETDRRRQAQMVVTLRVIRDMKQEMSDMQAELLALREQHRRARQPGPEARIPDHQDASGDADSHI